MTHPATTARSERHSPRRSATRSAPTGFGSLPNALADVLGAQIAEARLDWQREIGAAAADLRATVAQLQAQNAELRLQHAQVLAELKASAEAQDARVDAAIGAIPPAWSLAELQGICREQVTSAMAAFPPPQETKGIDPDAVTDLVEAAVARAVVALPKPRDGKDADPDAVVQLVDAAVARAVAALPPPAAGKDADPQAVADLVEAAVTRAVALLPKPRDGKDADPAAVAQLVDQAVARAVAALPPPAAGKDADPAVMAAMLEEAVTRAVAALPKAKDGKDGVGLASALIDRDGALVLTLSNGATCNLGRVVGQDAKGESGRDGFGFEHLALEQSEDERDVSVVFTRGDERKAFPLRFSHVLDEGVYVDGRSYRKGAGVTWAGSFWIAQKDTEEKPGTGEAWRLSVKRGRDGKNAKDTGAPPAKPVVRV